MLTYRKLAEFLAKLTDEQLDCHVSVYQGEYDEYFPADDVDVSEGSDVLDDGHPYITLL